MYKEQEELSKKTHCEIKEAYINYCSELDTAGAVFFPARVSEEKRKGPRTVYEEWPFLKAE